MADQVPLIADATTAKRIAAAVRAVEDDPTPAPVGKGFRPAPREFWAKITGSTLITDNRWKYAWTEQRRTATGFEDLPGGRSGADAINGAEANNGSTGVMGNGVDHDTDYPAGFAMQPIQGGRVVRMHVDFITNGSAVYAFEADNAEQGPCDDGGG